jgi:hypothetical protein
MVDFRKWFPALALAVVAIGSAATASAQTAPLSCQANAGATPLVRSEGLAELVGDVVIICQGGTPTAVGQTVPQVNVQIFLNTNVTSRLVADPLSEALILIDDPSPAQQRVCLSSGTATSCPVTGVGGSGVDFRNNAAVANVYQGRNGGVNSLVWLGIPVDPPGSVGQRTFRITNVRANANQLGTSSTLVPTQITMFISVTPFQALPINNPQQTVAFVSQGLTFSLRNAANTGTTSGVTFLQCVSNNSNTAASNTAAFAAGQSPSFIARFTEGFASSFKRRNVATTSTAPTADAAQPTPGGVDPGSIGGLYYTETGFYNPSFPATNGLNIAGNATQGTRLRLAFANVPAGAQLFAATTITSATASGIARLVQTDANGAGAYSAVSATTGGFAPLTVTGGVATAVYEVLGSDPLVVENFDAPITIVYAANTTNNSPALGTGTINGTFAPLSTVTTQSSTAPVPRFADSGTPRTAFTINPCQTNLLFPFVTNQAGFDTGLAISNTSLDPFGTPTQQGPCTINYYGATTGGGAAPAARTSPVVAAGTQLVWLLSSGGGGIDATPGFQGYIIARCNFQFAHGYAFISDIGAQRLAQGYLALVMDGTAPTVPRSGTVSEPLGH